MSQSQEYLYEYDQKNQEKRKQIAAALACGWTYERIAKELHTSPGTISNVKKMMKEKGEL